MKMFKSYFSKLKGSYSARTAKIILKIALLVREIDSSWYKALVNYMGNENVYLGCIANAKKPDKYAIFAIKERDIIYEDPLISSFVYKAMKYHPHGFLGLDISTTGDGVRCNDDILFVNVSKDYVQLYRFR